MRTDKHLTSRPIQHGCQLLAELRYAELGEIRVVTSSTPLYELIIIVLIVIRANSESLPQDPGGGSEIPNFFMHLKMYYVSPVA